MLDVLVVSNCLLLCMLIVQLFKNSVTFRINRTIKEISLNLSVLKSICVEYYNSDIDKLLILINTNCNDIVKYEELLKEVVCDIHNALIGK